MVVETIKQVWDRLDGNRSSIRTKSEDYGRWTLPYIFPSSSGTDKSDQELPVAAGSIGARAVNHLANKITGTLFVPYRPFFRLMMTEQARLELRLTNPELTDVQIDVILAHTENNAMLSMNIAVHRMQAVLAAKNLIITGNTLMYYPEEGGVDVYGLKDYVVKRDLAGKVLRIITRDVKAFNTFSPVVQDALRLNRSAKYEDESSVQLFTNIQWDGRAYIVTQAADNIKLETLGKYPAGKLPWIVLTWNLIRGEDYGRGLVEDYAYAFHNHCILSGAQAKLYSIIADLKFLVKPTAMTEPHEFAKAESGSYLPGLEGDIWIPALGEKMNIESINQRLQQLETEIAQAFLLNSAVTRDAERVTAEEIRMQANELEMSHGGIYSRLAAEWQTPLVGIIVNRVGFELGDDFFPLIITGMEALSRNGDLENMKLFLNDLSLTATIPDRFQRYIKEPELISKLGTLRNVEYEDFLKSGEQVAKEDAQAAAAAQAQIQAQEAAKARGQAAQTVANNME